MSWKHFPVAIHTERTQLREHTCNEQRKTKFQHSSLARMIHISHSALSPHSSYCIVAQWTFGLSCIVLCRRTWQQISVWNIYSTFVLNNNEQNVKSKRTSRFVVLHTHFMHSFCYFIISTVIKSHTAFHFVFFSSICPMELRSKINSMLSLTIDATN